jgi:hypothetical protein
MASLESSAWQAEEEEEQEEEEDSKAVWAAHPDVR